MEVLPEGLVREDSHKSFAQLLTVPLRHLNHTRLGNRTCSMRTAVGHKRAPASVTSAGRQAWGTLTRVDSEIAQPS